jgi:predicted nucleotidyltransferase component of viral defense system
MIPAAYVTSWRTYAPWPTDAQVEQDLVLSRALVNIFTVPLLKKSLAFRGGTALHKLIFNPSGRYSEDIDLVQIQAGEIGPVLDALRGALDTWLGEPKRKRNEGRVTLIYRFKTTTQPVQPMRLKVEINTREHFTELGFIDRIYSVNNPWFSGSADITTFQIEELLATKLRALHQRKKGRDLFDLWLALSSKSVDATKLISCFERYMQYGSTPVSRAEFEKTLAAKMVNSAFGGDVDLLLSKPNTYSQDLAYNLVRTELASKLPGAPWKGTRLT